MNKYRLVKVTKVSGFVLWVIQKKFLWWWYFVDSHIDKDDAEYALTRLRNGAPSETREVVG